MPRTVVIHHVADVDTWLRFKSERADTVAGLGGSNVADHVAQDGSNTVAITTEVNDVEELMTALSSPPPELGAAMEARVIPPLAIHVER